MKPNLSTSVLVIQNVLRPILFLFFEIIVITPVVVQALTNRGVFKRYPWANAPIQTGLVGFILIFATPLGCAFFSQMASIKVTSNFIIEYPKLNECTDVTSFCH